ncbi:MAG TPA: hypothetical protein VIG25_12430 [Pyrinomonadaceae bacterium]
MVRNFGSAGVNVGEETKALLSDANDVARTQLIRFRRRLGTLTHDQELQIENLLISTVTKISLVTGSIMEALAENHLTKEVALNERK